MGGKDDGATTFVRRARREQILGVAVEAIAEEGAAGASVSAVARRAGLSRGAVTYHFAGREALLRDVVAHVYALGEDYVGPRLEPTTTGLARVQAFVAASIDFYALRPHEMRALHVLYTVDHLAARADQPEHQREIERLGAVVQAGIGDGSLRDLDVSLVVAMIRGVLDHAAATVAAGHDPGTVADRVLELITPALATTEPTDHTRQA